MKHNVLVMWEPVLSCVLPVKHIQLSIINHKSRRPINLCISDVWELSWPALLLLKKRDNSWSALVVNNQPIKSKRTDRESRQKQDVREQQRYRRAGITLRNDKDQEDNEIKKNKKNEAVGICPHEHTLWFLLETNCSSTVLNCLLRCVNKISIQNALYMPS